MSAAPTTNQYYKRVFYSFIITMNVMACINICIGLVMLFMMYKMRFYKSRLLQMVMHLFAFQVLYTTKITTIFDPDPFNPKYVIENPWAWFEMGCAISAGVSSGVITNFISFTILVILLSGRAAHPNNYFYYFSISVPGILIGVPAAYFMKVGDFHRFFIVDEIYQIVRIVQVSINTVAIAVLYYRVSFMTTRKGVEQVSTAFRELTYRLMGYPLVGAIQRLSCSLYAFYAKSDAERFLYNVEDIDSDPKRNATTLIICLFVWALLAPAAILVDSAILLHFQKGVKEVCYYYLRYAVSKVTCGYVKETDRPAVLQGDADVNLMGTENLAARLGGDLKSGDDLELPTESLAELNPSELMDLVVRHSQRESRTSIVSTGGHASRLDSLSIIDSNYSRENGSMLILDYIMDTSGEPGVSPEEATRQRKVARSESFSDQPPPVTRETNPIHETCL